ncbi:hypothetical protein [Methylorubrum extorquens]
MERATRIGFTPAQIAAAAEHDRRTATCLFGLLGSLDVSDQRAGVVGLRRLLASMETAA